MEWRLLINRLIESFATAVELIDGYRVRWEIELFFHVLKNGCFVGVMPLSTVSCLGRVLVPFIAVVW